MKTTAGQMATLARPLSEFQTLHQGTLRRFGHRTLDLSYPNPREHHDPRPYQALQHVSGKVGVNEMRYSPAAGFTPARRSAAGHLSRRHGLDYSYGDVVLTNGATAAITTVLASAFRPGDRIIVPTPCWMDYPLYLAHLGLHGDLVPTTPAKHLDLPSIEKAWTPRTRGLILSQPACPTGVSYPARELADLADLLTNLRRHTDDPPLLISDEVHRDHVWSGAPASSPLTHYPQAISIYSYGKAWQMQGARLGYAAVSPRHHHRAAMSEQLIAHSRALGQTSPNSLMQHLLVELGDFTPALGELAAAQRRARQLLAARGIPVINADATPFVYAATPTLDDQAFVAAAAAQGLLVLPSTVFHEQGYFRIALNRAGSHLERALDLIAEIYAQELV